MCTHVLSALYFDEYTDFDDTSALFLRFPLKLFCPSFSVSMFSYFEETMVVAVNMLLLEGHCNNNRCTLYFSLCFHGRPIHD